MKFFTYSLFAICLFIITSCNKEDEVAIGPDIRFVVGPNLVTTDTTLNFGQKINIKITANKGNSNITLFQINIDKDGELTSIDSGVNTDYLTFEKTLTKGIAEVEKWTFLVRDKNLQSEEISITLNKTGEIEYKPAKHFGPLTLGAQNNPTGESFFSFENYTIYTIQDAFYNQDKINLLYYFDELTGEDNVISSPGANIDESVFPQENIGLTNWETRFTTRFIEKTDEITVEEFDACINDSLILTHTFEFSSGKRKCKNLVANDIFAFVTENQKEGLIKVIQVTGEKEGSVEFEMKWRE